MESYDIENEPMTVHKSVMDAFLKEEKKLRSDLISLYLFYYYTAKWQKTNQPKATSKYTMNGLGWGRTRFSSAKNRLLELGFIADIKSFNERNKIVGHYIYVRFIWSKEKSTLLETHRVETPDSILPGFHRVETPEGNALSPSSKNSLSLNSEKYRPCYYRFAKQVQSEQKLNFPPWFNQYSPAQLRDQIKNGVQTIERLVRLDKFEFETQIKPVILWAIKDNFWMEQVRTLTMLRNKSASNGETKFANMYSRWVKAEGIDPLKGRDSKMSDFTIKDCYGKTVKTISNLYQT